MPSKRHNAATCGQFSLLPRTPEDVLILWKGVCSRSVDLQITENRRSALSVRWRGAAARVRMNSVFLSADSSVLTEIGQLLAHGSTIPTPLVRRFLREYGVFPDFSPPSLPTTDCGAAVGAFFNLQEIFDALNREYFSDALTAQIVWGGRFHRHVKKRILGSCDVLHKRITINRWLDRRNVPRYAVEYVVFHEMLHVEIGVALKGGRRVLHPPEFAAREKNYSNYAKARRFFEER